MDGQNVFIPNTGIAIPMVLSENFGDMFNELTKMHGAAKVGTLMSQIYASWIIHNALWQDATESYYRDITDGKIYPKLEDAPQEKRKFLQFFSRHLYADEKDFLRKVKQRNKDFSTSSFASRHKIIMNEVNLWIIGNRTDEIPEPQFARICENIVFHGITIVRELLDVFINVEGYTIKPEAPLETLGIEIPDDPEELRIVVCARLFEILQTIHDEVRDVKNSRSVYNYYRKVVMRRGIVSPFKTNNGVDVGLLYSPPNVNGDGEYEIVPETVYCVRFYKEGSDVPEKLDDLPKDMRRWMTGHGLNPALFLEQVRVRT
jgi:hypothetical protein